MEVSSSILEEFELAPEEVVFCACGTLQTHVRTVLTSFLMNDVQVFNSSASELYVWQHIKKRYLGF